MEEIWADIKNIVFKLHWDQGELHTGTTYFFSGNLSHAWALLKSLRGQQKGVFSIEEKKKDLGRWGGGSEWLAKQDWIQ